MSYWAGTRVAQPGEQAGRPTFPRSREYPPITATAGDPPAHTGMHSQPGTRQACCDHGAVHASPVRPRMSADDPRAVAPAAVR